MKHVEDSSATLPKLPDCVAHYCVGEAAAQHQLPELLDGV
jgi:hypothetical protein